MGQHYFCLFKIFVFVWSITCVTEAKCTDKLNVDNPLIIPINEASFRGLVITSCRVMVNRYKGLCKREGRRACCKSCKEVPKDELKCLNDVREPRSAAINGECFRTCRQYVRQDPCRCVAKDVTRKCCKSCESIDTVSHGCDCRDLYNTDLRPSYTIDVSLIYQLQLGSIIHNVNIITGLTIQSCRQFADWYPSFCGGPTHTEIRNKFCCKTCKNVDWTCTDNLLWKANITVGNKSCVNCNCHEIRQAGRELMKAACKRNIQGINMDLSARNVCCHQCKRLGFSKPSDHKIDDRLLASEDISFIQTEPCINFSVF